MLDQLSKYQSTKFPLISARLHLNTAPLVNIKISNLCKKCLPLIWAASASLALIRNLTVIYP